MNWTCCIYSDCEYACLYTHTSAHTVDSLSLSLSLFHTHTHIHTQTLFQVHNVRSEAARERARQVEGPPTHVRCTDTATHQINMLHTDTHQIIMLHKYAACLSQEAYGLRCETEEGKGEGECATQSNRGKGVRERIS